MTVAYQGLSFVVETGAGLVDASSYTSVAYANTYHTQHGNAEWTAITDISIQQYHLIQATQSIDIMYGQEFYSIPRAQGMTIYYPGVQYLQALLFPRFTMVINQIQVLQTGYMPTQLLNAVSEVALMSLNGKDIFPQPNLLKFTHNKMVKVGGIATSTTFGREVDAERYPGFWKIDKILYPILKKNSNPSYMSL